MAAASASTACATRSSGRRTPPPRPPPWRSSRPSPTRGPSRSRTTPPSSSWPSPDDRSAPPNASAPCAARPRADLQRHAQPVARTRRLERAARAVGIGGQRLEGDGALAQVLDPDGRALEREAPEPADGGALELLAVLLLDQAGDEQRVVEAHRRQFAGRRPHEREVAGAQRAAEAGVGGALT